LKNAFLGQRLHREQLGCDENICLRIGLLFKQGIRQFTVAPRLEQYIHIGMLCLERIDDRLEERLGPPGINH
jgi:hypothetical protein